jgi:glycerate kinase
MTAPVTAYVESAQAAGLHLIASERRDPGITTTYGVGELIAAAIDEGAARIIVGLGGSATNDGGAGLLGALGATATRDGQPAQDVLRTGGAGLTALDSVDLTPARGRVQAVELIAATDVDNPLLGIRGASAGFGPQKGADDVKVIELDDALVHFSKLIGRGTDGRDPAVALGAGAAGGMGYALLCLGATRVSGIDTVLTEIGLEQQIAASDLVITGEGSFDWQSLRGKAVTGVAAAATLYARPCIVLAGRVGIGRREYAAAGVSEAFSVEENEGSLEAAMARPVEGLEALAQRVARTWGRQ